MDIALEQAKLAMKLNEIPVGAVVVKNGEIISKAYNLREKLNTPLGHAEILAINKASKKLKNWRLSGCELYVTLEPCPMCAGAILESRISKVYIGTFDYKTGSAGSVINILQNENLNYFVDVKWCYDKKCSDILVDFFKIARNKIK